MLDKIKNNKVLQITAIIALPTVLVAGYFGYKYFKRRAEEKKISKFLLEMREKYKNVNNIDEFVEGVKYVEQPIQFGYDLKLLENKKDLLSNYDFEKIKEYYEIIKKPLSERNEDENKLALQFFMQLFN